jgi:hypothetical protein
MAELPWFKFVIAHWMLDRNLAKCSSATRGVWLELIIAMHQDDRSGELRETVDHLAQLARTSTAIMTQALTELQTTKTADVTFRNTIVTVVNRKMKREWKERTSTSLRVKKHRSNKNVTPPETPQSKEVRGKSKEGESNTPADLTKSNLFRQPNIPTLELVISVFKGQGGTEEMAKKFFDSNQATGWFLKGSPITNFINLVPGFISNWNKNETKGSSQQKQNGSSVADAINAARASKNNAQ